jgi:hypothetical protein
MDRRVLRIRGPRRLSQARVMHHLLAGAAEHARTHGAEVAEGYPVETQGGRVDVISGYVGTVDLFERAGFLRAAPTTARSGGQPRWVMRKTFD